MAGRVFDDDPERAYQHVMSAQRRAGRVGLVREAAGLAAYRTGRFAEGLAELRAARRMTGSEEHLPVMADCERGLGRPERALAMADSPQAARLGTAARVELAIVTAGARLDLGQPEAAVLALQVPQLRLPGRHDWQARLFYAYSDALAAAGREDEAVGWLERAAAADVRGETDAAERLGQLGDLEVLEAVDVLEEGGDEASGGSGGQPGEPARGAPRDGGPRGHRPADG
jgi:hypothetical protein